MMLHCKVESMTHIEAMQGSVHSAVRLRYTRNSRCILRTLKQYLLFHAHALHQHFKYSFWTFMLVFLSLQSMLVLNVGAHMLLK